MLWLYGSYARGDFDQHSDIDILLIADESKDNVEVALSAPDDERVALSRYSWDEFEAMAAYGSLFLRHIRDEGVLLESKGPTMSVLEYLNELPPYLYVSRDLEAFRITVEDVHASPRQLSTPDFEAAVLATVFRHGSVLATYLSGQPIYGRAHGYDAAIDALALPAEWKHELQQLHMLKLRQEEWTRNSKSSSASWDLVDLWLSRLELFLERLKELVVTRTELGDE